MPAPTTLRLLGYPPQAGLRNSPPRLATCPSPSPPGSAGRGKARAGILCQRPLAAAHLPPLLQRHRDTVPSWGMDAPASRPGRPWRGQAGGWLSRPPPPRPSLRLRRLRAGSRGAPRAARVTAGSADSRRRLFSAEAGRAGAGAPRSCPRRGRPDRRRPCFCSLFLFFFFLPSFRPFPQNSTFLPSSLSFSYCGGGWTGEGEGRGGEAAGAGRRGATPPGRPRPRPPLLPPPPPGTPADAGCRPAQPACETLLRVRAAVRSRNSGGERAQGAPLHPSPRGPDSPFAAGYCLGLRQVAAAPRVKVTPGRSKSLRSVPGGMQISGPEAPFLPKVGVGVSTRDCGPPRPERETRRRALPKVPCRPQRPMRALGCAPRGHRRRGFGMGTTNVEIAHLNNQCSPVS